MVKKYVHNIYYKKIKNYSGYESFCYQNCQRIILEYEYGDEAMLFINTALSINIENEKKMELNERKEFRSLLPSIDKYVHRFYPKNYENAEKIFKKNIKFIYENEKAIIVGVDTYFLPYTTNYKKRHAKHTLILCGFDLTRNVVYIIDWYTSWFYKGEIDIKDFLQARNSKNEKDGTFYSGNPIENNWAYISKITNYSFDKLFRETIELSRKYYFNEGDRGIIAALQFLKKYISMVDNEEVYEPLFYYMYTLTNRRKMFMQYIEYYFILNKLHKNLEFIKQLKNSITDWDIIVILLLKQSKRYSIKTRNKLSENIDKVITEELMIIQNSKVLV